ncbi:MAG: hypothetical protein IKO63_04290 [Paludibacteraceae bacterium]|nr:hypothetical protein [Paludibacteraceae bacterium]
MKKLFFLGLMVVMAATMSAKRYYVMGDDRAIPMSANTSIMEKTELMLWIRDWGDQSLTCSLETSSDAGPSGFSYLVFMCHSDNSGAPASGYYGTTWAIKEPLDLTEITEDWKMVIICKTDVPVWELTVTGDACKLDLAAKVATKDNQTWQTIEIPMYDIFDKGISFAQPLTTGYLFNMLTNENTATTQLCIDSWYFTDGNDDESAVENVEMKAKATKIIENGQIVIIKNGVRFNALGTQL